ncbi:MAG TPA: hypothetical protein PKL83_03615, partial [bacterium]|nr:hypothetical protein [bacterium]
QAYAERANEMLSGSVAHLALALRELGDEERGRALLFGLEPRLQYEDTLTYLDDTAASYQHTQTKVYQTSLVLQALSEYAVDEDYVVTMANWLNQSRRSFDWYNVFDNSQGLRGLLAYAVAHDNFGATYNYTVALNGESVAQGKVSQGQISEGQSLVDIPMEKLAAGTNTLTVSLDAAGALYLSGDLMYWTEGIPESSRVSIVRVYRNQERAERQEFNLGDLAIVEIRYDGSDLEGSEYSRVHYQLTDYLPAGFEVVNTALDNISQYESQQVWDVLDDVPDPLKLWTWDHYGLDSIRREFGHGIPAVDQYWKYPKITRVLVRASFKGQFSARPSVLTSENIPSVYAYSTAGTVTIK